MLRKSLKVFRSLSSCPKAAFPCSGQLPGKMISLSVDGNISSGKSTLVSRLVDLLPKNGLTWNQVDDSGAVKKAPVRLQVEVIPEPLEKWCDVQGHNLLEMFYKDPKKYNFAFEHYVQLTRLMDIVRPSVDPDSVNSDDAKANLRLRIMERSLQNNRYCFMELAKKNGSLHPAEFAVLAEWHKWVEKHVNTNLDLIIYLQTEPKTAYERMRARARAAEELCPYEYLVDLHEAYEDWLVRDSVATKRTHVIVLDANQSKDKVAAECFLKLDEYLRNLSKVQSSDSSPAQLITSA